MPTPIRHPAHADELAEVARTQGGQAEATYLWLLDPRNAAAVYAERDRKANLPIPTPVGYLIPGSVVDIRTRSEYSANRTIRGAVVSRNHGLTTLDPAAMAEVRLERNGQSLRVKQREIAEIIVVRLPGTPVHGG